MNTHPGVSRTWVNASAATVLLPGSYPSSLDLVHDGHVICHSPHKFLEGNRKTRGEKRKDGSMARWKKNTRIVLGQPPGHRVTLGQLPRLLGPWPVYL